MSLDATRLTTALEPLIQAAFVASGAIPGTALTALVNNLSSAIASQVVAEITGHAVVAPGATLLSAAPGSPCTGFGTIT